MHLQLRLLCCCPDAEAQERMAEQEERLTKLFLDFLGAQDDGYQGSFEEYHWDRFGEESPTVPVRRALQASDEDARVGDLLLLAPAGCTSLHFPKSWGVSHSEKHCGDVSTSVYSWQGRQSLQSWSDCYRCAYGALALC